MKTAGLDVHKGTVFCCIRNGERHLEVKEYAALSCGIRLIGGYSY